MHRRTILAGLLLAVALSHAYIPVYVMLPLDAINNQVNNPTQLAAQLNQLKQGGVDGVMTDVWWGLVEQQSGKYNWDAYQALAQIVVKSGLKLKTIMSFHECGGNVGDACNIPLPSWVMNVGANNPDIFYTDREGHRDHEYLSCGVDHLPLFPNNRTAVDIYSDFMASFANSFSSLLGKTITEVQIGLGPAGEMRYPSYQLDRWSFPGVGEFQCYDKYLRAELMAAAGKAGQSSWGTPPNNAGTYNSMPGNNAPFFSTGINNYKSTYGQFFLGWYSQRLIQHGSDILAKAAPIFSKFQHLSIAAKISGIHWLYKDASHGAELTAGYKNDQLQGYAPIAQMFKKYKVSMDFTCLEMRDNEQPSSCQCGPEELVGQTLRDAHNAGIGYSGENALPRYDSAAYSQIEYESTRVMEIEGFDYLRLSPTLLSGSNWQLFTNFVSKMHSL